MNLANKPFILGRRDLSISSEEMKLLEMNVATFEVFDDLTTVNVSEKLQTGVGCNGCKLDALETEEGSDANLRAYGVVCWLAVLRVQLHLFPASL